MKKRIIAFLVILLLVLSACSPQFTDEEDQVIDHSLEEVAPETAIIPHHSLEEDNYRVLIDSNLSQARGVITNQISNRLDIDELEEGLQRHSKSAFDPSNHFFQEGQYITRNVLFDWLERSDSTEEDSKGLNPEIGDEGSVEEEEKKNPKYLSHILEQNYLTKRDEEAVELAGISLGIAMKSVYRFQTEIGGPYYYEDISHEEMMNEAESIVAEVIQRVRQIEGLENVPILIAIYREAPQNSLVPGNFVAKTMIAGDKASVDKWETIEEEYVLFPSSYAESTYPDISANIVDFEADISTYFPNYVSVIGKGFYQDGELRKLTIEIPVSFYGKAELVGFTQYAYGLILSGFQNHYDMEVKITSGSGTKQEALIFREAGEDEGFVHIYR
ncbi:protein involved in sex pheromone biosynthesis [Gracilibacillus halotolerans]|uniref:Protein involved in sex pheromone biosynthesis n=1 Tax=Gracilibacillus halotolerans TaxID=74386 RepID=A0A841RUE6_9BACI|nr:CamS family sex pheromone protein [Gracilibacillus halotolerans]MBB6514098.1 protein involved in sex pheromone biosynthesis [Gracilibacillus halotolerans]